MFKRLKRLWRLRLMTKNDILKKAEEYMKLKYRFELTEDEAEGGYVISYPDLIGCMSSGETIEEAVKNGEDARREWIIATLENGMEVPKPFDAEEYSGQFRLRMPKSLHKLLAERSKQEGISMNQYCIYLLSHYS